MTITDNETLTPQMLINIRPVVTAIREFFGSSPLSQFMDQSEPSCRVNTQTPCVGARSGGLSRDRASLTFATSATHTMEECVR